MVRLCHDLQLFYIAQPIVIMAAAAAPARDIYAASDSSDDVCVENGEICIII